MKLLVARVMPVVLALLVPSFAFAESPAAGKPHAGHVAKAKRPKAAKKAPKATAKPKAKAPKAAKKAPKAAKKAHKA